MRGNQGSAKKQSDKKRKKERCERNSLEASAVAVALEMKRRRGELTYEEFLVKMAKNEL